MNELGEQEIYSQIATPGIGKSVYVHTYWWRHTLKMDSPWFKRIGDSWKIVGSIIRKWAGGIQFSGLSADISWSGAEHDWHNATHGQNMAAGLTMSSFMGSIATNLSYKFTVNKAVLFGQSIAHRLWYYLCIDVPTSPVIHTWPDPLQL